MTKKSWNIIQGTEFSKFSHAWDGLNRQQGASPILDARFVALLLKHFGNGRERLAIYGAPDAPQAAAIVAPFRFGVWSTFQPSQAPVGLWVQQKTTNLPAALASLIKTLPGYPIVLSVLQQDPIMVPRVDDSGRLRSLDYIDTACVPIEGTYENYWAARGKNLRNNLRRQRNLLEREGTAVRFDAVTDPRAMRASVADYGNLESRGWKNTTDTAIHIDNRQGQFYADLLEEFASTGNSVVFKLYYDHRLVASDLCISGNGHLVMLKTTYDQQQRSTSPAMLLHQEEFAYLFDRGDCGRVEFFGRVMDWHTKWTSELRRLYHINLYRYRLLGLLRR